MKRLLFIGIMGIALYACGNQGGSPKTNEQPATETAGAAGGASGEAYDARRGAGKYRDVQVSATLDAALATEGKKVYDLKCSGCHKLSDEKLVGPGWAGVTKRRTADWILNFITNTEEMLDKDPEAQAQLEICLVRMPNQNLSDQEARSLYEFMRKNDGVK